MDQSIKQMHQLLTEVAEHLTSASKPQRTAAVAKLERIVAIASTLAFTLEAARR